MYPMVKKTSCRYSGKCIPKDAPGFPTMDGNYAFCRYCGHPLIEKMYDWLHPSVKAKHVKNKIKKS